MEFIKKYWLLIVGFVVVGILFLRNRASAAPVVASTAPVQQSSIAPEVLAAQIAAATPAAVAAQAEQAATVVVNVETAQGAFTALDVKTIIDRAYAQRYSETNNAIWIISDAAYTKWNSKVIAKLNAGGSPAECATMIWNG